ncbi:MAG: serine/threonine protein kinase [Acidobacteria bacterium]|nr:serine/threonine protein kinase [Acidobacteriota bacterium]MBV9478795.1 serine/threonine protein kinase [Acidobacteriota bacterium]
MELIGRRFGHIRVTDVVGQGGMGDVYSGYDEKLERKVALKVLHADQRLDAEARERLLREARALSRLDHPHICRIYDYIESGDVDLLVLEYIDGRTLHELVDTGMSRGEKLRIATAIAEVLVAAHRAGIVHRDLKPENVMLTRSGEVKVLDFGLARWLHMYSQRIRTPAAQAAAPAAAPMPLREDVDEVPIERTNVLSPYESNPIGSSPSQRPFLATAVGITMGTPLFMSPEQARGENLTTASDMFSFGLLLQVLFTGLDPHPADLAPRAVILRVARGETLPVTGTDGDVTSLINSLKAFAPADRPTAVDALQRLRFFADKPRRYARRGAVAALVIVAAAGGWRYTVDLQHERAIAVAARAEAEHRRAQAEDLINFMVGDLRTKLEPVGRLDVLNDVATKALQYVGESSTDHMSGEELVAHSKALNQLGEVRMGQGKLSAAVPLFRAALDRAQIAVRREPKNDEAKFALALSRFWLANSYRLQNDVPHAFEHARQYLSLTSDLAAREPENDKYQLEASYAHSMVGLLLEAQGDYKGAIAEYETTLAIKNAEAARHPADDTAKEDVAKTLNKLAFALQQSGDMAGARREFETELSVRKELLARNPQQMRWKQDLAVCHSYLASLLTDLGEDDLALEHRLACVRINSELVNFDASNTMWQRNLAIARSSLARQWLGRGELLRALSEVRAAEDENRTLLATDGKRSLWRRDATKIKAVDALVLLAMNRTDAARAKAEEAVRDTEGVTDIPSKLELAGAYLTLGSIQNAQHRAALARESWTRAASLLDGAQSASDVVALSIRARALMALGRRDDAASVIAHLGQLGYRNREFESLIRSEGY